jgi:hypothetical protein
MDEMTKYWKLLHRKRIARWADFFEQRDKIVSTKNRFVRGAWFLVKYPLQSFIGVCLYGNYIGWRFRDFTFDAGYMEFHIQSTGMTVGEALAFLNERNILLKEYVYRDVVSKKKRINAEKSLDYLFTKFNALKENKISNSESFSRYGFGKCIGRSPARARTWRFCNKCRDGFIKTAGQKSARNSRTNFAWVGRPARMRGRINRRPGIH